MGGLESSYHYYHNSTHAADVLHASAYFLQTNKLKVSRMGGGGDNKGKGGEWEGMGDWWENWIDTCFECIETVHQ